MALKVVCIACFDGDHANHRRVVRPAPRDGVGGDICDCQGECAANGRPACSTFDCNRPAVTNGRCENCERIVALFSGASREQGASVSHPASHSNAPEGTS